MAPKSRFIGGRFEPEQQRKLIVLSLETGEPGNMSAALRWLVDRAQIPAIDNKTSSVSSDASGMSLQASTGISR